MSSFHESVVFRGFAAGQEDLRVVFTHIDEAAPAREFSFSVHVEGKHEYTGGSEFYYIPQSMVW